MSKLHIKTRSPKSSHNAGDEIVELRRAVRACKAGPEGVYSERQIEEAGAASTGNPRSRSFHRDQIVYTLGLSNRPASGHQLILQLTAHSGWQRRIGAAPQPTAHNEIPAIGRGRIFYDVGSPVEALAAARSMGCLYCLRSSSGAAIVSTGLGR